MQKKTLVDNKPHGQGPGHKEMTHLFQNGPYITWPGWQPRIEEVGSGWNKWIDGKCVGVGKVWKMD